MFDDNIDNTYFYHFCYIFICNTPSNNIILYTAFMTLSTPSHFLCPSAPVHQFRVSAWLRYRVCILFSIIIKRKFYQFVFLNREKVNPIQVPVLREKVLNEFGMQSNPRNVSKLQGLFKTKNGAFHPLTSDNANLHATIDKIVNRVNQL